MRDTIKKIHDKAAELFVHYLNDQSEAGKPLCELESATFKYSLPTYTNTAHASLYLMRYAGAYIAEYFLAYKAIIEAGLGKKKRLSVISLGSGSNIDAIAALEAIKILNLSIDFRYLGVDKAIWPYVYAEDDRVRILNKNIFDITSEDINPITPIDVIFLPKIISEINAEEVYNLIKSTILPSLSHEFCIVFSNRRGVRTSDRQDDDQKMHTIINALMEDMDCIPWDEIHITASGDDYKDKHLTDLPDLPNMDNFLAIGIKNYADDPGLFCCDRADCVERNPIPGYGDYDTTTCRKTIGRHPVITTRYFDTHIYFLYNGYLSECPF